MSSFPRMRPFITEDEYLALEERSEVKHEYYRGDIFAMAGGSINHNRIAGNIYRLLAEGTEGRSCEAFTGDMRLLVEAHRMYTYPDAMVVCGEPQFPPGRNDVVTNPVLIVEVLSPSTRQYDRGEKFRFYRDIPTLQELLLVEQDRIFVEHWLRTSEGWLLTEAEDLDARINLPGLGLALPLARIYARVDWLP